MSYFSLFHCFDSTSQIKRLCWALAHSLHSSTKSNFHLKTSTSQVERLGWATHRRQCAYKLSHSLDKLRKHPSIQCPKYTFLQMKKLPWQETISVVFKAFPKISKSLSNIRLIQMPSHIKDVATGSRLHMRPFRPLGMQVWQHLFSQPPFPTPRPGLPCPTSRRATSPSTPAPVPAPSATVEDTRKQI